MTIPTGNGFSSSGHDIRWGRRETGPRDVFYTPHGLAGICVGKVPLADGDSTLDPCRGEGAFLRHLPADAQWCEVEEGANFYDRTEPVDWVISNPPYSHLDTWLSHTAEIADKGFAYLLGWNNLTARRIETLESRGFGITSITMFKVYEWYGMSAFVVWEKGKPGILGYDRTVWRG